MSKKKIERRLEELEPRDDDDGPPIMIQMTHFDHEGQYPTVDESPHPELTVQQFPEQRPKSLVIAVPNMLAEPYCNQPHLTVATCDTVGKHTPEGIPEENAPVPACELWEALDEADLEREKEIREENGEPIPELLAEY
ncbi:hypothetical protein [Halorubrum tibetense]|uniref:Uncharacterized protein n=1 Tax=Halorubrum tibetense TaxID=175631 RepID=A0ABD5S9Y4_9EURY